MTTQELQRLLDWQKLRDWASAKPEGYEIGIACTNSRCPLANYLGEMTSKLWSVGPSIKAMNGVNRERLDKPTWIQELIERVDLTAGDQNKPITREQFLQCLVDVKRVHDLEEQGTQRRKRALAELTHLAEDAGVYD